MIISAVTHKWHCLLCITNMYIPIEKIRVNYSDFERAIKWFWSYTTSIHYTPIQKLAWIAAKETTKSKAINYELVLPISVQNRKQMQHVYPQIMPQSTIVHKTQYKKLCSLPGRVINGIKRKPTVDIKFRNTSIHIKSLNSTNTHPARQSGYRYWLLLAKGSFELALEEVKHHIRSIALPHTELGGGQCKWSGKGSGEFTVFLVDTSCRVPMKTVRWWMIRYGGRFGGFEVHEIIKCFIWLVYHGRLLTN
jgi:hypothetical protein